MEGEENQAGSREGVVRKAGHEYSVSGPPVEQKPLYFLP